jgi:hypothetical protein
VEETYAGMRMEPGAENKVVAINMIIRKDSQIRDIQNEFHTLYPYLKIEFYKNGGHIDAGLGRLEKISPLLNISTFKKIKSPLRIEFSNDNKVCDIKQQILKQLGIGALIFRKSGSHWIETSLTEDWTLSQQNEEGKLLSDL